MNASEIGSKDWWLVVLSMPAEEALSELTRYRSLLLEQTAGKSNYLEAAKKITRVNDEIKTINRRIEAGRWQAVCKKILPVELYSEVYMQVRILQDGLKVGA